MDLEDAISELKTLYGIGGRYLRIRNICMEFGVHEQMFVNSFVQDCRPTVFPF